MSPALLRRIGLRSRLAAHLEPRAREPAPAARLLSSITAAVGARHLERPLVLPRGAHVIGVGGATLGGSYKTPFAIALAEKLAATERVVFVGHAYRARAAEPRLVQPDADVRDVGDDALVAALRLRASGVEVVVAADRQAAIDFAAKVASRIVVDGLLQTRPHRLARSMLLLCASDGDFRFCPPLGDWRASLLALARVSDASVVVHDELEESSHPSPSEPSFRVISRLREARFRDGRRIALARLAEDGARVGLLLALARPDRVVRALLLRGLSPEVAVAFADHHVPTPAELDRAATTHCIDVWLTTAKCATKLPAELHGAPILTLEHELTLPSALVRWAAGEAHGGKSLPSSPAPGP